MTSNQASGKTTARQIRIVGVVVFGAFLALLNQTVMSPALPAIMTDFGIDASTAQWIMSIYPLVSGIMVPVSAFLIDRFSTRVLFFAATAAFAAGTALCAAAPTFFLLICGRVLQAAASGVLLPLVSVVPMLVFPVEKRGTAMGVAGIVMSAGPAVGPVLGGAIIDAYSQEPLTASPLFSLDNVILSPHAGAFTTDALNAMSRMSVDQLFQYVDGATPDNLVTAE